MSKGTITFDDARLVHEFAIHMQPMLRDHDATKLHETAKTVERISYCAIQEARQNARAERAMATGKWPSQTLVTPTQRRSPNEFQALHFRRETQW